MEEENMVKVFTLKFKRTLYSRVEPDNILEIQASRIM